MRFIAAYLIATIAYAAETLPPNSGSPASANAPAASAPADSGKVQAPPAPPDAPVTNVAGDAATSTLNADVAGFLRWLELPDAPPLKTSVTAQLDAAGRLAVKVQASAEGLNVSAELHVLRDSTPGTWTITRGDIDLKLWWRVVSARFAGNALPTDIEATGVVAFSGKGTWEDGAVSGLISAAVANAHVVSPSQRWSAQELSITYDLGFEKGTPVLRSAGLNSATVEVAGVIAHAVRIDVQGAEDGRWQVVRVEAEALGGRVAIEPFEFLPSKPNLELTAVLTNLGLSDLAGLVPEALSSAQGQISGRVSFKWSAQTGIVPGKGSLRVAAGEGATLRLANSPGILTNHVTKQINVIPPSFGPLSRWLKQENPAYGTLKQVEEGQLPLIVERLEVELYPDGPNAERSAQINVVASPATGSQVKTVRFNVTVNGPLDEMLKLGLNKQVGLSFTPKE